MSARRPGASLALRWAGIALVVAMIVSSGLVVAASTRGPRLSVLCSSIEDLCQEWASQFTQRTGISTVVTRRSAWEALTLIRQPDSQFDVWHGGPAESYVTAARQGLLLAHRPPGADHVTDRAADGTWTGAYVGVLGFCSNRTLLARAGVGVPRHWDDLLDPRLRGLVSAPNPLISGTGYTLLQSQVARLGEDRAMAWLSRLDRQVLQYTSSGMAPAGVVSRGEAAVGVAFTQHCARLGDQGDDDLVISYPQEGTGREVGGVAIVRGTGQPAAARRYVDFVVSKEGQRIGSTGTWAQLPARDDVPGDPRLGLPQGTPLVELDPREAAGRHSHLVARFSREVHP